MRPPHRNDVPFLAAPQPHDRVQRVVHLNRAFPSVLAAAPRGLMNDGTTIEEARRANEIEPTILDRRQPFVFIP